MSTRIPGVPKLQPPPLLFADARFAVLNKPPGLPAHAGPRGGPSAEDWFPALSRRRTGPWLAHRLDADTAGCLLVALRREALHAAQALFAAGRAEKTYWAVVAGEPRGESGTVDAPLSKRSDRAGWRVAADPAGQPARTDWRVRGRGPGITWLELRPRTGRTHQVRVHCLQLGCPILGDPVYGSGSPPGGGETLHLLARALLLPLEGASGPPLRVEAPVPAHMAEAVRACGGADVA